MNNQNKHRFNSDIEKAINIAKTLKDKYNNEKKISRVYTGLKSTSINELCVDSGVVRIKQINQTNCD